MGRKEVRFCEKVAVRYLPYEERQPAWEARHSPYVCAPKHDELWDGNLKQFRPKPITTAELKRLRREKRVKKVMPSSVFALYLRYRKPLPEHERSKVESDEETNEKDSEKDQVVPESYIQRLTRIASEKLGVQPAEEKRPQGILKKPVADQPQEAISSAPAPRKRFSLPRLSTGRRGSPFFLLFSNGLEDTSTVVEEKDDDEEQRESFDSTDMAESMSWLESVQKLDGLSNTKVNRSASVDTLMTHLTDQLEELSNNIKLLGQSLIWDTQALLREYWPNNPIEKREMASYGLQVDSKA